MNQLKLLLKKLSCAPLLIRIFWKADNAIKSKNWCDLEKLTSQLHNAGFAMNQTRFWAGCALLQLKQYQSALDEFEKIDSPLDTIEEEASRHWNHTLALYRLDRDDECFELLMNKINPDWPTDTYWKSRRFLADHGFKAFQLKI